MMIEFLMITLGVMASAIFYHVPKKSIIPVSITGLCGYFVYVTVERLTSFKYLALLVGVISLGILAGFFARRQKLPTTVYFQPAIIPLVPGGSLYRMMYNMVFENYTTAIKFGSEAIMVAGILAIGIYLTSVLSDLLKLRLRRLRREKQDGKS